MNTLSESCGKFFDEYKIVPRSGQDDSSSDVVCLAKSVKTFLKSGLKEDAFVVYFCFTEIFNIFGQGYVNTKNLLDVLSDRENNSDIAAENRDWYSHSAYLFALGLAAYANDGNFRKEFCDYYDYGDSDEAACGFLKYWGVTSLFCDMGQSRLLACELKMPDVGGRSIELPYGPLARLLSACSELLSGDGTANKPSLNSASGKQKRHAGIDFSLDFAAEVANRKKENKAGVTVADKSFSDLYELAKLIHVSYNEHCKDFTGSRVDEDFAKLRLEFKVSNIEQAKSYSEKLALIDCFYSSKDFDYPVVTDINNLVYGGYADNREFLCRVEHVRWVKEKLALGWKYGTDYANTEERNRKKIHKCIVPYEQLSDEEKSKDALMIDGIFTQLSKLDGNVKIYNCPIEHKPEIEIAGIGHRYFTADAESLKRRIKSCLQQYCETHRVVVRTCLAYGADQLIAECALEMGLTLKAVIPLEYEDYIKDVRDDAEKNGHRFTDDDELRMRHLLAQTVVCKTVVDPTNKYQAASQYIVDKCDVLIALWDGKPLSLVDENNNPINRGGTYDSVMSARATGKTVHIIECGRD